MAAQLARSQIGRLDAALAATLRRLCKRVPTQPLREKRRERKTNDVGRAFLSREGALAATHRRRTRAGVSAATASTCRD